MRRDPKPWMSVMAAACAAFLTLAFAGAAVAQTPAAETPPAAAQPATPPAVPAAIPSTSPAAVPSKTPSEGTPAVVVDGSQVESILGKKVKSVGGDDMGRIVDIIADKTGQVRAAIIDFGGLLGVGSRQIAVDWKAIRFPTDGKSDSVTVDLSRDQLRVAPVYKAGEQIVVLGKPSVTDAAAQPAPAAAQQPSPQSPTQSTDPAKAAPAKQ